MRGGTYAEALKVGFTEKQAGMLARLSGETRDETIEYLEKREAERAVFRRERREKVMWVVYLALGLFICGALVGSWIVQVVSK